MKQTLEQIFRNDIESLFDEIKVEYTRDCANEIFFKVMEHYPAQNQQRLDYLQKLRKIEMERDPMERAYDGGL